ncbi:hypothetical protein BDN72DRAFT_958514, partial [Pluteus cervinus]
MIGPRLPPEVERLIFELALQSYIQDATNLFLVAHRVREWLTPKAFEVVLICDEEDFPTPFTMDKLKKYGRYVHYMCIAEHSLPGPNNSGYPDGIVSFCLSFCPNVISLAAWWGGLNARLDPSLLSKLPLTTMSIDPERLFAELTPPSVPPLSDFPQSPTHTPEQIPPEPLFSGIAHLEILNEDTSIFGHPNQKLVLILHFPNLTHIALPRWRGAKATNLLFFLENCQNLKALILWSSGSVGLDSEGAEMVPMEVRHDERLVVMRCSRVEDWKKGARGTGYDMWSFADMVLNQRRLGPGWRRTGQAREWASQGSIRVSSSEQSIDVVVSRLVAQ